MNPLAVGRWENADQSGEFLNIFDETPLRMKQSFCDSGHFNFEPICVYEKDGFLCWEINDEQHRMVYHLRPENGALVGWYTFRGADTPVRYARLAAVPEDAPYYYKPSNIFVKPSNEPRLDILKRYACYDRAAKAPDAQTSYELCGPVPDILREYGYSNAFPPQDAPDDALAFRLFDFVCEHFEHDGSGGTGGASVDALIRFCRKHNGRTNCRGLAILLAALLRLNGIKAQHVTCMPYEQPFDDCHVVVDCLLPSGRRVMLDPTSHLYYRDARGELVSLPRLREMLIAGEPLFPNEDASYNHMGFDPDGNHEYMVKNTVLFFRCSVCADGVDGAPGKLLYLFPQGYPFERLPRQDSDEFVFNDEAFWAI